MANDYLSKSREEATARARAAAANWVAPGSGAQAVKQGVLKEKVITCEVTGRKSREWSGDKGVWMAAYKKPSYIMLRINKGATAPHGGRNLSDFIKG
jgi:hypothetical protein